MTIPMNRYRHRTALRLEALDERIAPAAGDLDPSFGVGGIVTGAFSARGMAFDSSGRIIVGGYATDPNDVHDQDFFAARLNANGTFDPTFGSNGQAITDLGSQFDAGLAMALDGSGRPVVVGMTNNGSNMDFAIVRYTIAGAPDTSFGSDGKVTVAFGTSDDWANAVAIDHTGRIVVAGITFVPGSPNYNRFALARFMPDGMLDQTFGSGGKIISDFAGVAQAIAIDASGRLIVGGSGVLLARYTDAGTLDPTFGSGGEVTTGFGAGAEFSALAIDNSGRIIAAGRAGGGFALARYTEDGSLDPSFGVGGEVDTTFGSSVDEGAYALALDSAGRPVAAGYARVGIIDFLAIARYTEDGILDPTYGIGGGNITNFGSGGAESAAYAVGLDTSGRAVATGSGVARFLAGDPSHVISTPTDLIYTEDDGTVIVDSNLSISDDDSTNLEGATVEIGNYLRDQDVLGYTLQGGITASFDTDHGVLTFKGVGSISDYQAVLDSVTYTNTSNSPSELSRTLKFTVDDGSDPSQLGTASRSIIVRAHNDAPSFADDAVLPAIVEGTESPAGRKISGLFAALVIDPDQGSSLSGIAVIGNTADPAEGEWQYSTDNGGIWFDIGAVADDTTALALSAATRLRFLPTSTFAGEPLPLLVRALDDTFVGSFTVASDRITGDSSLNGGTTAISADTANIETTIFPNGTSGNTPPTLSGVPVSANINEGQTLSFAASATDPDLGQVLTFGLDGAPAAASIDPDTGAFSWRTTEDDGPDTFVFNVLVTDGLAVTEKPMTVIVREVNTPPTLSGVPATLTVVRGDSVAFNASAADPDLINGEGNTRTYSLVNAPVGAVIDPDTGAFSWTPADALSPGNYAFNVRVADDGVPTKSSTQKIAVAITPIELVNGDLFIGGTSGKDTIQVRMSKDGAFIQVVCNKAGIGSTLASTVTGRIVIHGWGGADRIVVSPSVWKPVALYGDDGNDTLTGGQGNDLLVGGDGNDKLSDVDGTNVLLGGAGADRLAGGKGDDLLIAGPTDFDNDLLALNDIVAEWTSGSPYEDRIAHLTGTAGGNNGTTFLSNATVHDDGVKDVLIGAKGRDYFAVSALDVFDLKSDEQKLQV